MSVVDQEKAKELSQQLELAQFTIRALKRELHLLEELVLIQEREIKQLKNIDGIFGGSDGNKI